MMSQNNPEKSRMLKKVYLKSVVGYKDPKRYWNKRWKIRFDEKDDGEYYQKLFERVARILDDNECRNVIEIGCGQAKLRELPGYLGVDFSLEALKQNNLESFLYADITKGIPLPDKCFDAAMTMTVLMHIPENHIKKATSEINRVTKKCIILMESRLPPKQPHCFLHDYKKLFSDFPGKLVFMNGSD